jgi:hypothetical protein
VIPKEEVFQMWLPETSLAKQRHQPWKLLSWKTSGSNVMCHPQTSSEKGLQPQDMPAVHKSVLKEPNVFISGFQKLLLELSIRPLLQAQGGSG